MAVDVEEVNRRLDKAVKKRDRLGVEIERLKGRLEEAQSQLKTVEERCREKKLDPKKLNNTIKRLETKYLESVENLESELEEVEEQLGSSQ